MLDPADFINTDEEVLAELHRQAESFLQTQVTMANAMDARALSFAATTVTAISVLTAGSAAVLAVASNYSNVGYAGLAVAGGLLVSLVLSLLSALPGRFGYPGNDPAEWQSDVEKGLTMRAFRAESLCFDSEAINSNDVKMRKNAMQLLTAYWVMGISLATGLAYVAWYFTF